MSKVEVRGETPQSPTKLIVRCEDNFIFARRQSAKLKILRHCISWRRFIGNLHRTAFQAELRMTPNPAILETQATPLSRLSKREIQCLSLLDHRLS